MKSLVFLFVLVAILAVTQAAVKFVCEHQTLSLACKSGEVISVTSALYGRTIGGSRCPHSAIKTTKCRSTKSLDVVKSACNGKQSCSVLAKNHVFGDPCVGTFKYLEVQYSCQPVVLSKFVCEHKKLALACQSGKAISVTSALYGRTIGGSRCPHSAISNQKCRSPNSLNVVKSECQGKQTCEVLAKNSVFKDPCVGTFKYLEVKYSCLTVFSKFVCEHKKLDLACKSGEVISVTSALYGRTIGGSRCPHSAIKTTKCRSTKSLDVVKLACNGKQSCSVLAKNHVFGDPCVGTFKYLEVKYSCFAG